MLYTGATRHARWPAPHAHPPRFLFNTASEHTDETAADERSRQ